MPTSSLDRAADLAVCRRLMAQGSRSFHLAARGLPADIRGDAIALYAFCRVADDAIDRSDAPEDALAVLSARLDAIYASVPIDDPVDRAMADVVARHRLPRALPDALLEGLAWDVADRGYETLADLRAYAARVAGSVGVMMTLIMGCRDADTLTRAAELGVAMQLTNISRDVGEDAELGRCYLPATWRREAGIGDRDACRDAKALAPLVARLLGEAERHYRHATPGIAALPLRCRVGVRAAARIYAEIGTEIAANDHDSLSRRAVVPTARKLALLVGALVATETRYDHDAVAPAGRETRFLIESVPRQALASRRIAPETLRWWQLGRQWAWVIELFEQMAMRERLDNSEPATSNEGSRSAITQQR